MIADEVGVIYAVVAFRIHQASQPVRQWKYAVPRLCLHCAKRLPPRRTKHCGAPECKRRYNNQRNREFMRKHKAEHGVSYTLKYKTPEQKAADIARLQARAVADPRAHAARKQERWHRRRAQKLALPAEKFRHEDVYERDGWICGLCTEPVDRELCYPDPMSASLDHIIPLSRGGHHVWENVQLAHLDCNVRKQARIAEEASWTGSQATSASVAQPSGAQ